MPETFLDELFNDRFFDFSAETDLQIEVSFPLPSTDASALPEFLASASGRKLKRAGRHAVETMTLWANANSVDPSALIEFKKDFIEYKGWQGKKGPSKEEDVRRIPFYREGLPAFVRLSELVKDENVVLSFKQDLIRNLLESIAVCSPGTHTNIINAYLDFIAQKNLAMKWMVLRRRIAEQYVQSLLKPYRVSGAMEIHYVNRVINENRNLIAVNEVDDRYQHLCNKQEIESITCKFIEGIQEKMTSLAILDMLMMEIGLEKLVAKVNEKPSDIQNTLCDFEKYLDRYGLEGDAHFTNLTEILDTEDYVNYTLSWQATYVLIVGLYRRLQEGGYLNPLTEKKDILGNTVFKAPLDTLRLNYVYIPDAEDKIFYRPFIVYYVKHIARHSEELLEWINENEISNNQSIELVIAINQYMANLNDSDDADEMDLLSSHLNKLIKNNESKRILLTRLPRDALQRYLAAQGRSEIIALVNSEVLLHTVLENSSERDGFEILKGLTQSDQRAFVMSNPFWFSVYYGNLAAVKYFADADATYLAKATRDGEMPLFTAVRRGHAQIIIELLSRRKIGLNRMNHARVLPLYVAAKHGNSEVVKVLVDKGALINKPIGNGETALFAAARSGHLETVKLLLKRGADHSIVNSNGLLPYYVAFNRGYLEIAYLLLPSSKQYNDIPNKNGETLLGRSVLEGRIDLVTKCLERGFDPNQLISTGDSLLTNSIRHAQNEILHLLLSYGASINFQDQNGDTPLHIACNLNAVHVVRELITLKAKFDIQNINGESPLHRAAANGADEIVQALLDEIDRMKDDSKLATIILNQVDHQGHTAFFKASINGEVASVKCILKFALQHDINCIDSNLFERTLQNGQLEVIRVLLSFGALNNVQGEELNIYINQAASLGFYDIAIILLIGQLKSMVPISEYSVPMQELLSAESLINEDDENAEVALDFFNQIMFYESLYRSISAKSDKSASYKIRFRLALDQAYLGISQPPETWAAILDNLSHICQQLVHDFKGEDKWRKILRMFSGKSYLEKDLTRIESYRKVALQSASQKSRELLFFKPEDKYHWGSFRELAILDTDEVASALDKKSLQNNRL